MNNSEPLRLGSHKSPMAISQSGDMARLITERTGRPVEIIDADTGTRRGARGGRGRPGHDLAARMLSRGAADLMRGENTDGNDAHD